MPVPLPKNDDFSKLTARIAKLEADAAKSAELWRNPLVIAASIAGCIALLGHFIALYTQHATAQRAAEQARLASERSLEQTKLEAAFGQAEKILEFRIKQLESFYAPVFALLEQSKALYIKMNYILAETEPTKYRRLEVPDAERYQFQVVTESNEWKRFRLLDQLPAVRANPDALPLVQRILEIGKQLTQIISEHAGLASADLVDLLGEYMAHYAIISSVYEREHTKPYTPGWHKMGYYPEELNERIAKGYRDVSRFIDSYAEASKNVLQTRPGPTAGSSR